MNFKSKKNLAFTLAEMLVCITVISAIIVIFLSSVRAKPNSNMVMFRKAYNITSNAVYDMLQTDMYYEGGILNNTGPTDVSIEGEKPSGATKFCKVFASYLNTTGTIACDSNTSVPSFTTLDGIEWYLPPKTGGSGKFTSTEKIKVDVNGKDNLPNCEDIPHSTCKEPDIFYIHIAETGKLSVYPGTKTMEYLQNSKRISK